MNTALVWFRNDLRVADNPALHHALAGGARIVPVYIHAPEEEAPWAAGAASRWWLHHSLAALNETLTRLGGRLVLRHGDSAGVLRALIEQSGARELYWNRGGEPAAAARDHRVEQQLAAAGVHCHTYQAALLCEPGSVRNKSGEPYKVFTPFWRACQMQLSASAPLPSPSALPAVPRTIESLALAELNLMPRKPWYAGLNDSWRPGETGAHQRLQAFCQSALAHYPQWRDYPDRPGTSRLSPHLHFGEISARQILWTLNDYAQRGAAGGIVQAAEALIRQLGWREFAHHILHHFPHTDARPLNPRFDELPWRQDGARLLHAWQRGQTGFPIVDAGMRQLWHSGWMHNRVRMIAASFLVKNCRIDWREGARWFWDTLVDADLANNSFNWQWVAGCGADATPYFRIFNPILQFDAEGRYLRRWLPELAALPARWIHQPWAAPQKVLDEAGIHIGADYPAPILDLDQTRRETLALLRAHLGPARKT